MGLPSNLPVLATATVDAFAYQNDNLEGWGGRECGPSICRASVIRFHRTLQTLLLIPSLRQVGGSARPLICILGAEQSARAGLVSKGFAPAGRLAVGGLLSNRPEDDRKAVKC